MTQARAKAKSKPDGGDSAPAKSNGARRQAAKVPGSDTLGPLYAAGPALSLGIPVQAKLAVGPVDDVHEREADAVAQRVTANGSGSTVQRQAMEDEETVQRQALEEEETVQRQTAEKEEAVQRQVEEEESVQRQVAEEEPVQRQAMDEEESLQRQVAEEEETLQRKSAGEEETVQRQAEEETVQAAGDGPRGKGGSPRISPSAAATIRSPGPGQPIPGGVRRRIEPQLGTSLSGVQVHNNAQANRAAASINARAFTHRNHIFLGSSESPRNVGLMAHEATHVVQQGAAPVQRQAQPEDEVQRLPGFIMEELNDYARHIPGYTLFTVIIGYNPLLGESVDRNAINLLEGLMGLVPFGTFIFDKLRDLGIIQDAFAWVEGEMSRLDLSLGRIERTIEAAWDDVDLIEGFTYNLNVVKRHFSQLYDDVVSFAESLVNKIIELIKEAAIGVAEGLLAENKAWDLIKKILKYDPLRDEPVEATTVEILEDFLRLIGKETELEQMQEKGTLQETADWLDTQFALFMGLLVQLRMLIVTAWDAIQPENLPNLMTNLETLATQAIGFLQQVWDFASTIALQVLEIIKNSLLSWLSTFAHEVPGFHLITVLLGINPFTGEAVARSAENILRGFITLLPGGNAIFAQLQETGVIGSAAARIEGAVAALGITAEFIIGIFTGIWDTLSIEDLIDPIGAFTRIRDQFGEPISRLFAFIRVVLEEVFKLVLALMNFPTDLIMSIVTNAMQAFNSIKNDPIGFFLNILRAVKVGFTNFFNNILQHLLGGLVDWLFRGLRDAGIEPPADLSLSSILDLVLQILGLSMDRIWEKLAERFGQETVDRIRGGIDKLVGIWNFVRDVQERGVVAIWEYIEGQISGLWDMILQQAQEWIMERIINRAIQWLLSLLDPTGIMPVINSFLAFFRAVQSAIEYIRDILEIINDYVSTIAAIARGEIQPGAEKMEQGLANAIPIAIGFLANQFGLGNIGEKVQEIIAGIRGFIDRALDWLLDQAERALQSVMSALGLGGGEEAAEEAETEATTDEEFSDQDLENWWLERFPFTDAAGDRHTLEFEGAEENARLAVHSNGGNIVSDWLVARRETVSEGARPLVDEALVAYDRFLVAQNNLEALREEFEGLPEAQQDARRDEYTVVYRIFRTALRELGRTFSALPVEAEPDEIVLNLPPQKPLALYQQHVSGGRLQHSRQRPARHTRQVARWEQEAGTEITNEWMDYGRRMGLTDSRILRPDWDRRGAGMPMQVDHRVEWQVRPIGDESTLDEPWNYELLDAASNTASGSAINAAINQERERIAQDTGDQSWLQRDLTFTQVTGGGSQGRRWLLEDIANGQHLKVYARIHGEPPASGALPSAEEALEAQSGGGEAEATERGTALQSTLRTLGEQYPEDAGDIRRLVELRMAGQSYEQIRGALGVTAGEFTWLRSVVTGAGIHL